ncbi:hypothetical protein OG21DRAFT_1379827, partial [Imleria badia]
DMSEDDADNTEGWVDEMDELTEAEQLEVERSTCPVKLALLKLHKLGYKIIHSTTIILPAWRDILRKLCMSITYLPRDVATRWHLTFDMLEYALKHRMAVDKV